MESRRFDALTRALGVPGSRRHALVSLLGGALGLLAVGSGASDEAAAKKRDTRHKERDVKAEGPCGNGSARKNRCRKDRHCCTDYCKQGRRKKGRKRTGRCRCRKLNQSCTEDRNCCPERTGRTCIEGVCQPAAPACDVCATACRYPTIQAAIDDPSGPATIRLCPGTYRGTSGPFAVEISRDVTLIGAGDGADPASNTILDGERLRRVVNVGAVTGATVALRNLRLTRGLLPSVGGGLAVTNDASVTMTGCTVIDNEAGVAGGGIYLEAHLTMIDCRVNGNRVTDANSQGGGIYTRGTLTLDATSVTGNSAQDSSGQGGGVFTIFGTTTLTNGSSVSDNTPDNCVAAQGGTFVDPAGGCAAP